MSRMSETPALLHRPTRDRRLVSWRERLRESEQGSWEELRELGEERRHHLSERATYVLDDAIHWLSELPPGAIHAIVTDPPYGVLEYEEKDHNKLRAGRGGVWRI